LEEQNINKGKTFKGKRVESSIHGFMRTELMRSKKSMEEEKDFGERRRKLSGGERV
jgi:hypothetical protein